MIYVTYDQVEAMTMTDKIVVLQAGCVEHVGSPIITCLSFRHRIYRFAPHEYVASQGGRNRQCGCDGRAVVGAARVGTCRGRYCGSH
jgi:ABC-type sulfate/molybdate transport systems ATPase subunit